jgi:putative hydrolase of the HAD superfamily
MPSPYCEIFRKHSRPLEPVPTGEVPVLRSLPGIRAVLFDVYGTLFISGSGEVGTANQRAARLAPASERPLDEALHAMGIATSAPAGQGVKYLFQLIEMSHGQSRAAGIDHPEVDIVELWRKTLGELARRGVIDQQAAQAADPKWLAVEYEARTNPCWPMPHLTECLDGLRRSGQVLGLVSNAQFYTPELFEALTGKSAEQWGFLPDLQYYSYRYGCAKPGLGLFERAVKALRDRQIAPGEVLYVGNDMLNDVSAASNLGLHTALFAGDARSLRRWEDRPQLAAVSPDLVLTDLMQIAQCIIS